jgi:hypothetical protein
MGDRARSHCSSVIREITKKCKKRKKSKKDKITNKNRILNIFQKFNFFEKKENELTRQHF